MNREKLIPWHERRAVAVAVDQARDPVGLDDFAKALFCLRRPPFRHAADPREMLEDDDRTPAVSDMFCEVVAEELERTRGIVLRAVHAFHIERTGAAEEVELHEMQVVPIPRIVEPIFRDGLQPCATLIALLDGRPHQTPHRPAVVVSEAFVERKAKSPFGSIEPVVREKLRDVRGGCGLVEAFVHEVSRKDDAARCADGFGTEFRGKCVPRQRVHRVDDPPIDGRVVLASVVRVGADEECDVVWNRCILRAKTPHIPTRLRLP